MINTIKFKLEGFDYIEVAKQLAIVVLAIIALISPALLYGYPLIHPDTKSYIYSGFANFIPYDRPIGYGWFCRHISLLESFWIVIVVQACILLFMLWVIVKYVLNENNALYRTGLISVVLAPISYISLYTSMLMPDIFAAYVILGFWAIYASQKMPRIYYLIIFTIIFYSNFSHFSNLALSAALSFLMLFVYIFNRSKTNFIKLAYFSLTVILSLFAIKMANNKVEGTGEISKGKNIILMARLVEMDVVSDYLEEYDIDSIYSLTKHTQQLRDMNSAADFVWNPKSPLFEGDCIEVSHKNCWKVKSDEYGQLIKDIAFTPKFTIRIAWRYFKDGFKQFYSFNAKNHYYQDPTKSTISSIIKKKLPKDYVTYSKAVQMNTSINSSILNKAFMIVFLLSVLLSIVIFLQRKRNPNYFKSLIIVVVALLTNGFVCSTLSNVVGRYQGRVIWILTFLVVLYLIKLNDERNKNTQIN